MNQKCTCLQNLSRKTGESSYLRDFGVDGNYIKRALNRASQCSVGDSLNIGNSTVVPEVFRFFFFGILQAS
jgi:hypothetical protein